ncbi:piggyBac transposable element-derived protein 3-like [Onthophagus taurus]|uniref:piggyBac transposable element-derived protein 3-like n=1 Tax=Onthophagus taurus TaxID=166361 RepID=UPI0039BE983F
MPVLSVGDIITLIAENDELLSGDIFITPPDREISEEDSGDEESVNINHLSRCQLLAEAEYRARIASKGRVQYVHDVTNENESFEFSVASASTAKPSTKRRRIDVTRKWNNVYELLRSETERNAIEKGNHAFRVTTIEIMHFIGILLMSGYNSVARYKMYWEKSIDCNYQGILSLMSRNRFEELLRYFHVADNANLTQGDKFAKVRPLWDLLNKRWLKYYPGDRNLSIDESMIPYYGKHGAKQHIHGKPIRFGYKTFSICTRLGYLIHGELYQGASTGNTHPAFGVGGSVVLDLLSRLPPANYSLYMDNFFTSLPLLNELKKLGHDATETIQESRVEKAPLQDKKEMKKMKRG